MTFRSLYLRMSVRTTYSNLPDTVSHGKMKWQQQYS